MVYHVIGVMSGSSLDGLDIVFAELEESGGKWTYEIKTADCFAYNAAWTAKLENAVQLDAYNYLLLNAAYGKYCGEKINSFIDVHQLQHQVQLIAFHGHTTFHAPQFGMTAQLGDGATIAAITGINVVTELRMLDIALGGQGAPIVPMGEKLLLNEYDFFLNIGGIANITLNVSAAGNTFHAFDICPANKILNLLVQQEGKNFDEDGNIAAQGNINTALLEELNAVDYYKRAYPKSLANNFGTEIIFPIIQSHQLSTADALRTYVEHIAMQVSESCRLQVADEKLREVMTFKKILVTGGGAFNKFLMKRITEFLLPLNIETIVAQENLIKYKEALIMALLGVLRWREENTVMNSVTGAVRSSIGGAVWIGQEA